MTSGDLPTDSLRGHMAAMDDTDRLIVEALRGDGRMSMRALADLIHISRASAYARVARLEREGVITGYAALVDPVRYGYALSAYVYLDIAQRSWKSVRSQLLSMPEVDHVALVSGEHDILLRVRARDAVSLRDVVLTRLQDIPNVRSTQTVLIFEEVTPARAPVPSALWNSTSAARCGATRPGKAVSCRTRCRLASGCAPTRPGATPSRATPP